jgi:hypothetical protein
MENKQTEKDKSKLSLVEILIFVGILIFIVGGWLLSPEILNRYANEWSEKGTIGDSFGAVNALFSGLAFAGLIFAILLQRKELKLQREELEETRVVFQKQSDILHTQTYEATFFRLVEDHRQLIQGLDYRTPEMIRDNRQDQDAYYGLQLIRTLAYEIRRRHLEYQKAVVEKSINKVVIFKGNPYEYIMSHPVLNQSFGSLTHILDFVFSKLKNDDFYHQTLYNSMHPSERFIFGFYFFFKRSEGEKLFQNIQFQYDEYYKTLCEEPFSCQSKRIPKVKIEYSTNNYFSLNQLEQSSQAQPRKSHDNFIKFDNRNNASIEIKKIQFINRKGIVFSITEAIKIESKDTFRWDFSIECLAWIESQIEYFDDPEVDRTVELTLSFCMVLNNIEYQYSNSNVKAYGLLSEEYDAEGFSLTMNL